jgi:hypothetical protein
MGFFSAYEQSPQCRVYQNQVLKGLFNTSSYLRTAALS